MNSQIDMLRAKSRRVPITGASVPMEFGMYHRPSMWMCATPRKPFERLWIRFLWRLHYSGMIDRIIGKW